MKSSRLFFYTLLGIYHIAVFSLAYYIDSDQKAVGLSEQGDFVIPLLKQITFAGLFLFLADLAWSWYTEWSRRKQATTMQAEIDRTKAKMYDMKEDRGAPPAKEESDVAEE